MRDHIQKEHETDFKCKECDFKTKYKIVRRRHMLNAHKKPCKRCDHVAKSEGDLNAHQQAEHGILTSSMGFMVTSGDPVSNNADVVEEQIPDEEVNSVDLVKKRKTKIEYLMDERQVKSSSKRQKEVNQSFKDLFLTQKKNVSNLQRVHGAAPEFVLIVKNNVQKPGGKNAAATAGKYMVASRGNLREMMFSTGIKFTEDFVMMANDYDMQIDEYPDKNVKS